MTTDDMVVDAAERMKARVQILEAALAEALAELKKWRNAYTTPNGLTEDY